MKRKKVPEKIAVVPNTDSVYTGIYAVSDNGHLSGRIFVVLGTCEDGYLLLADGKKRKIAFPKRKKISHVTFLIGDPEIAELIRQKKLTDGFLRKKISETKQVFVEACNIQKL